MSAGDECFASCLVEGAKICPTRGEDWKWCRYGRVCLGLTPTPFQRLVISFLPYHGMSQWTVQTSTGLRRFLPGVLQNCPQMTLPLLAHYLYMKTTAWSTTVSFRLLVYRLLHGLRIGIKMVGLWATSLSNSLPFYCHGSARKPLRNKSINGFTKRGVQTLREKSKISDFI